MKDTAQGVNQATGQKPLLGAWQNEMWEGCWKKEVQNLPHGE